MGDDLGDEWWQHDCESDGSEAEAEAEKKKSQNKPIKGKSNVPKKAEKRTKLMENTVTAKKKKKNEEASKFPKQKNEKDTSSDSAKKRKRKKKTITDVLAASEPKPGCPADLQNSLTLYFSDKRSVIEQEELKLHDSCFLTCNDLTHSLSSYLKQICPKWAKVQRQHTEKKSVVLLIVCSSALRAIELIKQLTTFRGEAKAVKLFAKHIKIEEQMKLLQKGVVHIGVGTPCRISALIQRDGLSLQALRFLVLDWNWRDQKCRRMIDIPEIKLDVFKLLESWVLDRCKADKVKIGLF
ncbi:protein CMSS1 isoform X1 [Hippocampus comes]|uniref:Cms1 ribosomal small subunit homolog n=2 Tax=Hippocampus comes TaxID=109280 RepID=A0A3Q2XQ14_HIPCM|nr:PREDICTED: protein CMSS1 isoform X1 [Hippocampus comes]